MDKNGNYPYKNMLDAMMKTVTKLKSQVSEMEENNVTLTEEVDRLKKELLLRMRSGEKLSRTLSKLEESKRKIHMRLCAQKERCDVLKTKCEQLKQKVTDGRAEELTTSNAIRRSLNKQTNVVSRQQKQMIVL